MNIPETHPRKVSRKWPPLLPQSLPQRYRDLLLKIGASAPSHVYTRTLYHSDIDKGLNRLNFLPERLREPFLTRAEEDFAQPKDANKTPLELWVRVVDPGLVGRTMILTKWNWRDDDDGDVLQEKSTRKPRWLYALYNNWMEVVEANGLVEGDSIQVWSFRVDGQLGFVIHKVAEAAAPGDSVVLDGSSTSASV